MSATIAFASELLRTLHRIHTQRADLRAQLDRGPMQLHAIDAQIKVAQKAIDEKTAELKRTRMTADEKQLQLKTREDRVRQLGVKLNEAASNKEFTLLKDQIAAEEQANSVQSDEIFEVLERIDGIETDIAALQTAAAKIESDSAQRRQTIETRLAKVREDLTRVNEQLADAEGRMPSAAKADYHRLVAARGPEAMAPIVEDACDGCNQMISAQTLNRVTMNHLTHCPNCNAWLYLPEDRRVG